MRVERFFAICFGERSVYKTKKPIKEYTKEINSCWVMSRQEKKREYPYFTFIIDGKKTKVGAHRVSWSIKNGPIPKGMVICHTCDNKQCINPDHLFLGTYSDNLNDAIKKGKKYKLTLDQRNEIIAAKFGNGVNTCSLAEKYGVKSSTISSLRKRHGVKRVGVVRRTHKEIYGY